MVVTNFPPEPVATGYDSRRGHYILFADGQHLSFADVWMREKVLNRMRADYNKAIVAHAERLADKYA